MTTGWRAPPIDLPPPDIGDDGPWFFYETFIRLNPGGLGKKRFAGIVGRSRNREAQGAAYGERNWQHIDDRQDQVLAWCLLGLGEAQSGRGAAFRVAMLRQWPDLPPTRKQLHKITQDARFFHLLDIVEIVENHARRVGDKIDKERRRDPDLFARRIAWLRSTSGVRETLERTRYLLLGGRDEEAEASIRARNSPRSIEAEVRLEEEAKGWP